MINLSIGRTSNDLKIHCTKQPINESIDEQIYGIAHLIHQRPVRSTDVEKMGTQSSHGVLCDVGDAFDDQESVSEK